MNRTAAKKNKPTNSVRRKKDYRQLLEECITRESENMPQNNSTILSYLPWPILRRKISMLSRYARPGREYIFAAAGKVIDPALKLIRGVLALLLVFLIVVISTKGTTLFWLYIRHCGVWTISRLRDV